MLLLWISAVLISKNTFKIRNDPFKTYCHCVLSSQLSSHGWDLISWNNTHINTHPLLLRCLCFLSSSHSFTVSVSAGTRQLCVRVGWGFVGGHCWAQKGQPLQKSPWAGEAPEKLHAESYLRMVPSPQETERCVWVSGLHPHQQPGALPCPWAGPESRPPGSLL